LTNKPFHGIIKTQSREEITTMSISQRKKSTNNNYKRIQKEMKKRAYPKDNSVSCKEYKQARQSYREECEEWG
jgi:hypothetical protein